jgi:hypothetical protein
MRVLVATLLLAGCATFVAETPQQRAYAAVADLRGAVAVSATYCSREDASVERCRQLGKLVHQALPLVEALELALAEGTLSEAQIADLLRILADVIEQLERPEPVRPGI